MERFAVVAPLLTWLALTFLAHSGGAQVVVVRVFDDVSMPGKVLAAAEEEAALALATGGISVRWIDCSRGEKCRGPLTPNELVVIVRRSRPASMKSQKGEILGNAAGPQEGSGVYVWIWYDEVRSAATSAGWSTWHNLLAYVIAHEIGHLFLGREHYSGTLMQAHWGARELELIARGRFRFDAEQRVRMQRRAWARAELASAR